MCCFRNKLMLSNEIKNVFFVMLKSDCTYEYFLYIYIYILSDFKFNKKMILTPRDLY